jgi:hypothetical protein
VYYLWNPFLINSFTLEYCNDISLPLHWQLLACCQFLEEKKTAFLSCYAL